VRGAPSTSAAELAKIARGRRILLLAPHPDDVAYSCGGTVAVALGEAELHMGVVFSRSGYAASDAVRAAGPDAISAVRRAEDEAFCARYRIRRHDLGLPDSSLAGHDERSELRAAPVADPRCTAARDAIRDLASALVPDIVCAPCGLGGHVDHAIVHRAARELEAAEVWFYEDVPYVARLALDRVDAWLSDELGLRAFASIDIDERIADKIAAMWLYPSQTDARVVELMERHARRLGPALAACERLWRVHQ
jgi:LmbE family N-acetylglucosaminyl deacetylase